MTEKDQQKTLDEKLENGNSVKQQSPNWKKYENSYGFIKDGFPFNEGFPLGGPYENENKYYELIMRTGEKEHAQVDYSTQYRDQGLSWRTEDNTLIDKFDLAACKEL